MTDVSPHTNSIFEQPWWLDALAPNAWQVAEVRKGNDLHARMPFAITPGPMGMKLVGMPPLTQTLGPWLKPSHASYAKQLSKQKDLLSTLAAQLPDYDYLALNLSPKLTNWLPFHWLGFQQTTRYTYRLEDLSDMDAIWSGFQTKIRTDIRKAEKQVEIRDDLGIERFLEVHKMTFKRQGKKLPYSEDLVRRLDEACAQHKAHKIFFAQDAQNRVHAVVFLVWDQDSAYYLLGGGDPELRNSGATSLAVWNAIQFAADVTRAFDFEGSMLEPVERFFRGFGAVQTPYFRIEKQNTRKYRLYQLTRSLVREFRRG